MTFLWLREKTQFYIWNELHSIVAVKCKHSSISRGSPTGGMKKNTSFCSLEKREHHISDWTLTELANTLKNKSVWRKFPWLDLLLISLVHHTHNSLGNWAENIRVLLNWKEIEIEIEMFIGLIFRWRKTDRQLVARKSNEMRIKIVVFSWRLYY